MSQVYRISFHKILCVWVNARFYKGVVIIAIIIGCLIPSLYSAYTDAVKRDLYDYITIPIFLAGTTYSIYSGDWFNILIALITFVFFLCLAIKGGVAGGDVKFTTALAVWFGFPSIIYVLLVGSILAVIYGVINYYALGVLKERMKTFFLGLYFVLIYKVRTVPPKQLPEGVCEEAVPFGTFLVIAAWIVYLLEGL